MEEFERIKKLVEKSNKYCLYVGLEDIKTLIRIIETMDKKAKLKNESRKYEKLTVIKTTITPEELAEAFEKHIPNIE